MPSPTQPSVEEKIILFLVLLFAVLLSIKYFPGLESSHYYAGFTINAIHPNLMAGDPIVGNELSSSGSPFKLTIYYLLPKMLGEIWLDDRFIAILYVLSVAASFLAAARIAVALGARGLVERAMILLVFLKDHALFENSVNFAHQPDFHHSAVAMPIALWLFYAAIRGRSWVPVVGLSLLLAAVSLQVAPFTIGMALIGRAVLGNPRERTFIAGLLAAGVVIAAYGLLNFIELPLADRIPMWELLVYDWYEGMVIPFDPRFRGVGVTAAGNGAFALVMGIVLLAPAAFSRALPGDAINRALPGAGTNRSLAGARAIVAVAVALWVGLGVFVQFAPDSLKYPQMLLFPVARQLQYPQVLGYIAAMVILFRLLDGKTAIRPYVFSGLALFLMVLAGPGNYARWAGLFVVSLAIAIPAVYFLGRRFPHLPPAGDGPPAAGMSLSRTFKPVLALTLGLVMATAMAVAAVQKAPAWKFLFQTGIHGASANAPWVGVDTYLRANTPEDAVLLPMRYANEQERPAGEPVGRRLVVRRSVASRSGRAVSSPMMLSNGLNMEHFRFARRQRSILKNIEKAWMEGNTAVVAAAIERLVPKPGYVIVPAGEADRVGGPGFPFVRDEEVKGFAILKRRD